MCVIYKQLINVWLHDKNISEWFLSFPTVHSPVMCHVAKVEGATSQGSQGPDQVEVKSAGDEARVEVQQPVVPTSTDSAGGAAATTMETMDHDSGDGNDSSRKVSISPVEQESVVVSPCRKPTQPQAEATSPCMSQRSLVLTLQCLDILTLTVLFYLKYGMLCICCTCMWSEIRKVWWCQWCPDPKPWWSQWNHWAHWGSSTWSWIGTSFHSKQSAIGMFVSFLFWIWTKWKMIVFVLKFTQAGRNTIWTAWVLGIRTMYAKLLIILTLHHCSDWPRSCSCHHTVQCSAVSIHLEQHLLNFG